MAQDLAPSGERVWRPVCGGTHLRPSHRFRPFGKDQLGRSVAERFEEQVRLFPGRIAVKDREQGLTYEELNGLANRIARATLERQGGGAAPVLLLLEKGAALVAAMLGVLKAGKFYVPLSPTYPPARNALIADDSQATLILTDAKNQAAAEQLAGDAGRVLNVDGVDPNLSPNNLGLPVSADDYAYVIYTSGSTGRPKGVVDTHRNLLQNIRRYTNSHFLSAGDRLVSVNSCAFSNSLKDIFGALLNGGRLLLFDVEREGLAPLAGFLAGEGVTVLNAVATVFRHFAEGLTSELAFPRLRIIRLGSEAVTRNDLEFFRRRFTPGCVLVNGYGATETGTVRVNFINGGTDSQGDVLPIGYPVDGTEVVLLDDSGAEVGFDRVGQIAVRSDYLSPGYWRRPGLTAAAFRPDPAGGGRRVYLTGDLGLLRLDGCLLYAGRKDFQVKVRGNRVETAEVELALAESPGVREAVVVGRSVGPGDARLVAYVVPRDGRGAPPDPGDLRDWLRARLPAHAVPSAFVFLGALPQTPTGKIDRKALPDPPPERPALRGAFLAPRDPSEARLARLWEELLEVSPVGVRDNFFELGGHSLTAAQLFLRIGQEFGKHLPMAALFEAGTVESLARLLGRGGAGPRRSCLVPVHAGGSNTPFYLVHGIGGEVLSYQALARHLGPEQPFFGFQSLALCGGEPHRRVEEMACCYVEELLRARPAGPYYLGGYSCGAPVAYDMAQRLRALGHDVGLLVLIDQRRPNLDPDFAWSRVGLTNFLRNIPHWLREDFLGSAPRDTLSRVRAKAKAAARRVAARLGFTGSAGSPVEGLFDLSKVPSKYLALMGLNYQALRRYRPSPYPGRVALIRARSQPLFRWHEPLMGWSGLLTGEVDLRVVPGTHDGMLAEPCVITLAQELGDCLERARSGEQPRAQDTAVRPAARRNRPGRLSHLVRQLIPFGARAGCACAQGAAPVGAAARGVRETRVGEMEGLC
jgi:amino acid adenylation domain-containing protein